MRNAAQRASDRAESEMADPSAATFFDDALPRVYGYFSLRVTGDRSAAEDLTQETFLAFASTWATERDRIPDPLAWLVGIARHKLLDYYRRRAREDRFAEGWSDATANVPEIASELERLADRDAAISLLATLPERQRIVLLLRYAEGLTVRETAEALGTSEHAVESLLARGRRAVRAALTDELESDYA